MAKKDESEYKTEIPIPAKTSEGREDQLIHAAFDLVEWRIHNGTASAQETVHFLKLGSTKSRLEESKLENEVTVLKARVEEMKSRVSSEAMYQEVLEAMRVYSGAEPKRDGDFDEDVQ